MLKAVAEINFYVRLSVLSVIMLVQNTAETWALRALGILNKQTFETKWTKIKKKPGKYGQLDRINIHNGRLPDGGDK